MLLFCCSVCCSPQQDTAIIAQLADNYIAPIKRPLKQFTRKRKTASASPPASPAPGFTPIHHPSPLAVATTAAAAAATAATAPAKKQWHRPDPLLESDEARFCKACGITTTPQWRRGPDGERSLCNACGLHFYKIVQREKTIEKDRKREVGTPLPIEMLLNNPDY
jgi:hypothetical protein